MKPKNLTNSQKSAVREILYQDADGILRYCIRRGSMLAGMSAGRINKHGYREVRVLGLVLLAHRIVWFLCYEEWPMFQLDHRDLNKDNLHIENLRQSTPSLNQANKRPMRDGLKGATMLPNGKFQASVKKLGKSYYLGCFDTEQKAHNAYCQKATELFGEYARSA